MQKIRTQLLATAALVALTGAAYAADMAVKAPPSAPPVAAFSWTGFYAGVDGGYAWGARTGDAENFTPGGILFGPGTANPTGAVIRPQGGLAGGEAGFNWQTGLVVVGIETDIQWADITASASVGPVLGGGPAATYSANAKMSWFGTTRGRLGLAFDRGLVYITGGAIYGHESVSDSLVFPAVAFASSASSTRGGATFGAGYEYAFTNNLSAKVEWLYYDMGTIHTAFTSPINGFTGGGKFDDRGSIVRGGLNWHFNGLGGF